MIVELIHPRNQKRASAQIRKLRHQLTPRKPSNSFSMSQKRANHLIKEKEELKGNMHDKIQRCVEEMILKLEEVTDNLKVEVVEEVEIKGQSIGRKKSIKVEDTKVKSGLTNHLRFLLFNLP